VRERILAGAIAPLAFIREDEIGRAMRVSRTPVREALNRLASEGFLERLPHRGFRVPERAIGDLLHLYPVLQALEVLAAELAFPRLSTEELDQLAQVNESFARALDANDVSRAVELNDEFHRRLSEASGNPVLNELLLNLRAQVRRLEVLDFTWALLEPAGGSRSGARWVEEHRALVAAIRRGKFDRARELVRENRSFVFRAKVEQVAGRSS
jgi:DNA-binding GntR family transcriptional regulator